MSEIQTTQQVPPVLLEIFVYGNEKEKVMDVAKKIQEQLEKKAYAIRGRILWFVDANFKTDDEFKNWFMSHGNCKYYVSVNETTEVPDDFVKTKFALIKKFEKSFSDLKEANIVTGKVKKNSPLKAV